jgi:hypothetical protein
VEARGYVQAPVRPTAEQLAEIRNTGRLADLEVRLHPAVDLRGRVFGPDGQPVEGVEVRLTSDPSARHPREGRKTVSRESGRFKLLRVDALADLYLVVWRIEEDGSELRTPAIPLDSLVSPVPGGEFHHDLFLRRMPEVALDLDISGLEDGQRVLVGGREIRPEHSLVSTVVLAGPQRVVLKAATCEVLDEQTVEIPEYVYRYHLYLDGRGEGPAERR